MFVRDYFNQAAGHYSFSRQQGSDFAKGVAGDFNPLHDIDNSRFCVPGDLLFGLTLTEFGVREEMTFDFKGMVGGDVAVYLLKNDDGLIIQDEKDKELVAIKLSGALHQNPNFIESLIRSYVAFSGETFPTILVRLMEKQGAMINVDRPMVIYEQMQLKFDRFSESDVKVSLLDEKFEVNGKRGLVTLSFDLQSQGQTIGRGQKQIIMGGLKPYQQADIDRLVATDQARRADFAAK